LELALVVDVVEALGSDVFVSANDGLRARLPDETAARRDDFLRLEVKPGKLHLFDTASGERLA
jgi:hypothetical protein